MKVSLKKELNLIFLISHNICHILVFGLQSQAQRKGVVHYIRQNIIFAIHYFYFSRLKNNFSFSVYCSIFFCAGGIQSCKALR